MRLVARPRTPQAPIGPHHHRHRRGHHGPGGVRLDGQQDERLIGGGSKYYANKAVVSVGFNVLGQHPAPLPSDVKRVEGVEGVGAAMPDPGHDAFRYRRATMGTPEMITADIPGGDQGLRDLQDRPRPGPHARHSGRRQQGHGPRFGLARKLTPTSVTPSPCGTSRSSCRHLRSTLTAPDKDAYVPLAAAQELFVKSLRRSSRQTSTRRVIATGIVSTPRPASTRKSSRPARAMLGKDYTVMTGKDFDACWVASAPSSRWS